MMDYDEKYIMGIIRDENRREQIMALIKQSKELGRLFYEDKDGECIGHIFGMDVILRDRYK